MEHLPVTLWLLIFETRLLRRYIATTFTNLATSHLIGHSGVLK